MSFTNFLRKNFSSDYLIICIVALVLVLTIFRTNTLVAQDELGFFFKFPERWIHHSTSAWWEMGGTGYANPKSLPMTPFQLAMLALKGFGFSPVLRQAIVFFFLIVMSGISMYLLTKFLIRDKTQRIASLVAGIVYMLNPYTGIYVWSVFISHIFVFPFLPLIVLFYLKGIRSKRNMWKNAIYINLAMILPLAAFTNPAYLFPFIFIPFLIFCLYILQNFRDKSGCFHAIKFSVTIIFLGILLNLWWILPLFINISSVYQEATAFLGSLSLLKDLSSRYFPLSSIVRGLSSDLSPLLPSFSSVITFFLPILAFSALLFKKKNKYVLSFSLLALFSLFLCTGSEPPFGGIFTTLFKSMPFSASFRNPYNKFGMFLLFSYSFLAGVALSSLYSKLKIKFKNRNKNFLKILSLLIIGIVIAPTAFSISFRAPFEGAQDLEGGQVVIPSSYEKADDWLSSQENLFRIISSPITPFNLVAYHWQHGYHGMDLPWKKPTIASRWLGPQNGEIIKRFQGPFVSNTFWKVMAILNSKYVLVHKDCDYSAQMIPSPTSDITYPENPEIPDYTGAARLMTDTVHWNSIGTPRHEIMVDNTISKEGQSSIKIISYMEEECYRKGGLRYTWENTEDLSGFSFVSFWLRFESLEYIAKVFIQLTDINTNYKEWDITDYAYSGSWVKVVVPLKSVSTGQSKDKLDLSKIEHIRISFRKKLGSMEPSVWWIDDVQMVPGRFDETRYISKSKIFENLIFYQVEENFFLPRVYATSQYTFTDSITTMMFNDLPSENIDPRNATIFVLSQLDKEDIQFIDRLTLSGQTAPQVTFQKIRPTKYEVHIKNAVSPFFLVFSSTYDTDWKAYNGEQNWFTVLWETPISGENHFVGNGYANVWYIDPNKIDRDRDRDFTITLYFRPQSLQYIAVIVSLTAFAFCVLYLFGGRVKKLYCRIKRTRQSSKE